MNTLERQSEGAEVIRKRHNLDYKLRRVLGEPRNPYELSAQVKLERKSFPQIMQEYADLRRSKGLEYQPKTVGQAFLQFASERNATDEQVIALAFRMGKHYDFDEELQ